MMSDLIKELREKAEKADKWGDKKPLHQYSDDKCDDCMGYSSVGPVVSCDGCVIVNHENGDFINAANPQTILKLLSVIEELMKTLEESKEAANNFEVSMTDRTYIDKALTKAQRIMGEKE